MIALAARLISPLEEATVGVILEKVVLTTDGTDVTDSLGPGYLASITP